MSGAAALAESLKELREFFEERKWKHCLIGGLAANQWGEPRFTQDIDIVVFSGIGDEASFVDALLAEFPPRAGRRDTRAFALENRVLLLHSHSGVPIDVSLGALEFEDRMTARAAPATVVAGQTFRVATAEDIIVMKTVAGRPQDWQDVTGIIVKQGAKLDWKYIQRNLAPLLESMEAPERGAELAALRQRLEGKPRRSKSKPGPSSRKKKKGSSE
jgi:hypothetical protein